MRLVSNGEGAPLWRLVSHFLLILMRSCDMAPITRCSGLPEHRGKMTVSPLLWPMTLSYRAVRFPLDVFSQMSLRYEPLYRSTRLHPYKGPEPTPSEGKTGGWTRINHCTLCLDWTLVAPRDLHLALGTDVRHIVHIGGYQSVNQQYRC
jgi:hypothetical protein